LYADVSYGVQRLTLKANAIFAMQGLMFHARGWAPVSDDQLTLFRAQMRANASAFMTVHNAMFDLVQGTSLAASYTSRYITITRWDVPPNGVFNQYQYLNLAETGNLFATTISSMSTDNITNYGLVRASEEAGRLPPAGCRLLALHFAQSGYAFAPCLADNRIREPPAHPVRFYAVRAAVLNGRVVFLG